MSNVSNSNEPHVTVSLLANSDSAERDALKDIVEAIAARVGFISSTCQQLEEMALAAGCTVSFRHIEQEGSCDVSLTVTITNDVPSFFWESLAGMAVASQQEIDNLYFEIQVCREYYQVYADALAQLALECSHEEDDRNYANAPLFVTYTAQVMKPDLMVSVQDDRDFQDCMKRLFGDLKDRYGSAVAMSVQSNVTAMRVKPFSIGEDLCTVRFTVSSRVDLEVFAGLALDDEIPVSYGDVSGVSMLMNYSEELQKAYHKFKAKLDTYNTMPLRADLNRHNMFTGVVLSKEITHH